MTTSYGDRLSAAVAQRGPQAPSTPVARSRVQHAGWVVLEEDSAEIRIPSRAKWVGLRQLPLRRQA